MIENFASLPEFLVVDDDEDFCEIVEFVAHHAGYDVQSITDGKANAR